MTAAVRIKRKAGKSYRETPLCLLLKLLEELAASRPSLTESELHTHFAIQAWQRGALQEWSPLMEEARGNLTPDANGNGMR